MAKSWKFSCFLSPNSVWIAIQTGDTNVAATSFKQNESLKHDDVTYVDDVMIFLEDIVRSGRADDKSTRSTPRDEILTARWSNET